MDILEIEHRWSDAMLGVDKGDLTPHTFIQVSEELLQELAAHEESEESERLDYFIRLSLLPEWAHLDGETFATEFPRLYALHQEEPERFPAHWWGEEVVVGARPNVFANLLPTAAVHAAGSPLVPRSKLEELQELVEEELADTDAIRESRIALAQAMDRPEEALTLAEGHPLPSAEGIGSESQAADWLHRQDRLAMAYLKVRNYEAANEVVAAMLESGFQAGHQPMIAVAESLNHLAAHIPIEESVNRAHCVLEKHAGELTYVEPIVKVAEFLVRGGLHEEALALVEQCEPYKQNLDDLAALASFFAAAEEAGLGERELPRFAFRRWQEELGVHAVTVAELAHAMREHTLARARAFDQRNESDGLREDWVSRTHEVPTLTRGWFVGTALDTLPPAGRQLVPLPLDAKLDPRIPIFVAGFSENDKDKVEELHRRMEEAGGLPEDEALERALVGLAEFDGLEDPVQLESAEAGIIKARGEVDSELARQLIDLSIAASPRGFSPAGLAVAAKILPLFALVDEDAALQRAVLISLLLRWQHGVENDDSIGTAVFAAGLVAGGAQGAETAPRLAVRLSEMGRHLEAIPVAAAALSEISAHTMRFGDPLEDQIRILRARSDSLKRIARPALAAQDSFRVAELLHDTGERPEEVRAYTVGIADLLEAWDVYGALHMLDAFEDHDEDGPWERALIAGMRLRAAAFYGESHLTEKFADAWARYQERALLTRDECPGQLWREVAKQLVTTIKKYRQMDALHGALKMSSWLVDVSRAPADKWEGTVRVFALDTHGANLSADGRHEEAALVFESLAQYARKLGDRRVINAARRRLVVGAKMHPAYEAVLRSLEDSETRPEK